MGLAVPSPRFRAGRYTLGSADDGSPLVLAPVRAEAAGTLAREIVTFGPWTPDRYAVDAEALAAGLTTVGDGAVRYEILCGEATAGVAIIRSPWLAGPYLQLLAVRPDFQRRGVGGRVLDWLDAETRGAYPNIWLCVSSFNESAIAFYRAHGFGAVATLDALMQSDIDEILMRKRLV